MVKMKVVQNKSETKKRKRDDSQGAINESPKKAKVHAQRKFAQGAAYNTPSITVIKDKVRPPANVTNPGLMLSAKRPNTEDFLTFLCFRRTNILPPKLYFFNDAYKIEPISNNCIQKAPNSTPATKNHATETVTKSTSRKSERNESSKKVQTPVQALRRKYQEQRLAKQKPTNVTKLAQKVKGKNMIRTRSSTLPDEKPKPCKELMLLNEGKEEFSVLRSGLQRSSQKTSKYLKKNKSIAEMKNLRSRMKGKVVKKTVKTRPLPEKKNLRNPLREVPSTKKSEQTKNIKSETSSGKGKEVKMNMKKIEGLSDFSSDDNEPLLAVRKGKAIIKGKKLVNGVKEVPKSNCIKTRSQFADTLTSSSSSGRPTRKTKEAAAIYMEMITKKLVSPEKSGDDDRSSVDSFPELPNAKRNEQRESEIKARAMALKKSNRENSLNSTSKGKEKDLRTNSSLKKKDLGKKNNPASAKVETKKNTEGRSSMRKGMKEEVRKRVIREPSKSNSKTSPTKKTVREDPAKKDTKEEPPKKILKVENRPRNVKDDAKKSVKEDRKGVKEERKGVKEDQSKSEDSPRKVASDHVGRKTTREEVSRKTVKDEGGKKGAPENSSRKGDKEEPSKKVLREEALKKGSHEDLSKKVTRDETHKKPSQDEIVKKSSKEGKEEPSKKQGKEESTKKFLQHEAVSEDTTKKTVKEESQKKPVKEEVTKKQPEDGSKKSGKDELVRKSLRDDAAKRGTSEDLAKKVLKEDGNKRVPYQDASKKNVKEPTKDEPIRNVAKEEMRKKPHAENMKPGAKEEISKKAVKEDVEKKTTGGDVVKRQTGDESTKRLEKNTTAKEESHKKIDNLTTKVEKESLKIVKEEVPKKATPEDVTRRVVKDDLSKKLIDEDTVKNVPQVELHPKLAGEVVPKQEIKEEQVVREESGGKEEPQKETGTEPEKQSRTEPQQDIRTEPPKEVRTEPPKQKRDEPQKEKREELQKHIRAESQKVATVEPQKDTRPEPQKEAKEFPQKETKEEPPKTAIQEELLEKTELDKTAAVKVVEKTEEKKDIWEVMKTKVREEPSLKSLQEELRKKMEQVEQQDRKKNGIELPKEKNVMKPVEKVGVTKKAEKVDTEKKDSGREETSRGGKVESARNEGVVQKKAIGVQTVQKELQMGSDRNSHPPTVQKEMKKSEKEEGPKRLVSPPKVPEKEDVYKLDVELGDRKIEDNELRPLPTRDKKQEEPEVKPKKNLDRPSTAKKPNLPSSKKGSASGSSVPSSSWLPSAGQGPNLVEAPTFYPTEKEFQDPLEFFERIRPAAESFGLCRIVPPSTFKPDCKVSDDMRFTAYNQYVHRMFHRWGPNIKEMMAIKKYLATQSISLKQPPWIGGIEVDLPRLYQSVQNCGGLMKVMEKKKWNQVADMMRIPKAAQDRVTKLDDIYCKYLLPYDTLSHDERQKLFDEVERDWLKRQESTSDSTDEDSEEEFYIDECEECIVKGRNMALNQFYRIARNTMSMWFKNPEPSPSEVENEFWRHVSERTNHVCVHSGSIDSSGWGYGFPVAKNNSFSRHPWNLKVLTNNSGSVLRSLGPVMGVTVPTLHVGMVFTAFCWYRDPHGLPWVEYLHTGAPKIWYGISDDNSAVFKDALTKLLPRYIKNKKIWLPSDTAMVPPALLVEQGVSLCHTIQKPGQFILVFPRAFTSSICTGYLVSESVYFAQPSWLTTAEQVFKDIQDCCEPTMFSLEKLLFSIATDTRSSVEVLKQVLPMVWHIKQNEIDGRKTLFNLGLKVSERLPIRDQGANKKRKGRWAQDGEGDYECEVCRMNLNASLVINSQEEGVLCLPHAIELLTQKRHHLKYCKLMYSYTQEELCELVEKLEQRIESKSQKKVQGKLTSGTK